jgi:hypothetical protein
VQRIGWILAILLVAGWLASEIPLNKAASQEGSIVQTCWRRTVNGWENSSQWDFFKVTHRPEVHPLFLSLFQCTAATAIAAFSYMAMKTRTKNHASTDNPEKNSCRVRRG